LPPYEPHKRCLSAFDCHWLAHDARHRL